MNPIPEDKIFSLQALIGHMVGELEERKMEILTSDKCSRIISDIITKHVPTEKIRLAGLLIDDLSLAYPRTNVFSHEYETDAFKIIKWCVYERINHAANEWHENVDPKWREMTKHDHDHYIRSVN